MINIYSNSVIIDYFTFNSIFISLNQLYTELNYIYYFVEFEIYVFNDRISKSYMLKPIKMIRKKINPNFRYI